MFWEENPKYQILVFCLYLSYFTLLMLLGGAIYWFTGIKAFLLVPIAIFIGLFFAWVFAVLIFLFVTRFFKRDKDDENYYR